MPMRDKRTRHRWLTVGSLLLTASASPSQAGYFPLSFEKPSLKCGNRLLPVMSKFKVDWYSRLLSKARETSLYEASDSKREPAKRTVRFTWLRSFHHPIVIRVQWEGKDDVRLIAKELSGSGGDEPGHVQKGLDRRLSEAEILQVRTGIFQSPLFLEAPKVCDVGFNVDGAQWIVEGGFGRAYRLVDRWSPRDGEVRRTGLLLLKLTGWDVGPIY